MSIKTHDGTNNNGLFDLLGVAFNAIASLNTARGEAATPGTAVTDCLAILTQFAKLTPTTENSDDIQGVAPAVTQWQSGGSSLTSAIQTACQNILNSFIQADTTTVRSGDLTGALGYLIAQMTAGTTTGGDHVAANTPSSSGTAAPATNTGDLALLLDTTQGDGTAGQNVLVETIAFTVTSTTATANPSIAANTAPADTDRLDFAWPAGSGLSGQTITVTDPANSLLQNGQFESGPTNGVPDEWIPYVATPGTTLTVTSPCIQNIVIGGSPTGGTYVLTWSDGTNTYATAPIPWNATGGTVQQALQAIAALSSVTVTDTGTSPNFTHGIEFDGLGGAVANLGYKSFLTGGSPTITQSVVDAADSNSYAGQSLIIVGTVGAELTTLYQALPTLQPDTVYFLHFRANVPTTPAGGVLVVSIVKGIGGAAAADSQGNSGSATITLSGTSPGWTSNSFSFRIAPNTPQPCYLKVAMTTAITSGDKLYLDDFALTTGQQLYNGGPIVAAFRGKKPSAVTDTWSYTVTNTWSTGTGTPPTPGGGFQTYFNRVFGMADLGLILPTAGATLIADALIT